MMKTCLHLMILAAIACGQQLLAAEAVRPNVVVLLADDLGYKDVGCYGGPVETPAIDGLAARGTRFSDFYSGCAVCSPSRATLLTGRHHIRTGVYSWIDDRSQRSHLLEREVTLAELLKEAGYATAHVGKWHLGLPTAERSKPTPDAHGFDYWFATWNNASPSHRDPDNFIRNGEPAGKITGYSCQIVADEAIRWLDRHRPQDRPFFLNVWFHEPHAPIAAPDEIVERYGETSDSAAVYSGTIDNTDRAIARLLAKLQEIAPAEETLIVYASDNGSYRKDRVGDLRGQKGVNWEGGIRVPGIVSWPGVVAQGRVEATPAGLVDMLPTVCGLLRLAPPAGVHLDGSDLSPLLMANASGKFTRHQPLFWHLQKSRPIVAMRDGRWSLVADPDYELSTDNMFREAWIPAIKSGGYKNWQLYDLESDPSQQHDLAASHPQVLQRLKTRLLEINASVMADGADWHRPVAVQNTQPALPPGTRVIRDQAYVRDGHDRQQLDLYLPSAGAHWPVVVWVHGGAWRAGSKDRSPALRLVADGYAVASMNYRLSQHATFPAQIEDCKAAVRWLRAHANEYGYDARRIGAWGSSAGGHLVALMGTTSDVKEFDVGENLDVSSAVQAVVDFFGPTDFLKMNAQAQPHGRLDHDAANSPESALIGAPIQQNPDKAARANPISYVSATDPPFLIMHGEQDYTVAIGQSELLHAALQQAGISSTFHRVPDAGHGFGGPDIHRTVVAFLDKHLKNADGGPATGDAADSADTQPAHANQQ